MSEKELPKAYEPGDHEDSIYKKWEKSGYFKPQIGEDSPDNLNVRKNAKAYTIVMPPPNRTGVLHVGHAAMLALEDILIRYHRMLGERCLWVPGTDHAAIATQTKVEKIIKAEGTDRHKMGKEKFLRRVREFAEESHDTIINQVKKMGCSCDWSREAYTLDATRSKAVRSVFKMMYDDGLIYRGERIVNWCPRCHSTLADDEVEYKAQKAKLYTFKYSHDFPFAIATTRPETKLGDTAVAVNPKDKRYRKYIGQVFEVNFVGVKLKLKIIADREVDAEFGTGALGVTPAHSAVDAQMAEENNLPAIKVIDEDGKIKAGFGRFGKLNVLEAREMIVKALSADGLIEKEEEIENNLSICYRCDTPIEPLPSLQWFIDVNKKINRKSQFANRKFLDWEGESIKDVCLEVVKSGKIKIIPKRFEKNYFHWMENLRDWCISRQIWFGHRVPVWHKASAECGMRNAELISLNFRDRGIFELIKNGKKTIETRALNPDEPERYFGNIKGGDTIIFNYIEGKKVVESLKVKVGKVAIYKTSKELLENEAVEKIFPGHGQDNLINFWKSIPGYAEKVKNNGVIAIAIKETKEIPKSPEKAGQAEIRNLKSEIVMTLVRHGQTDWNKNGIMQGQSDIPLNGQGKSDAAKLAAKIKNEKFDIIITSPLKRTSQTAKLLNSYGVDMIEDDRLKERNYGKYEGLKTAMLLAKHPEIKTFKVGNQIYWIDVPSAETYDEVKTKVKDFLEDIKKKYAGKRILVVSHGDTLDMFYAVLNNLPNEKAYGRFSLNMRLEKYSLPVEEASEIYVGVNEPSGKGWTQDSDTLDTWFSSGLWTFSTLAHSPGEISIKNGWLEIDSDDFKNFHPTSVLETGYDILFFWVARMIIMTTYAVGEIPFKDVYLHGLVRDEKGRKMSKSLGNVIDPLDMIKKYGTDATRLSLIIGTTPGNDLRLSEEKIAGYRNFVNKLWNISRYIMQNVYPANAGDNSKLKIENLELSSADRWILKKMKELIKNVSGDLNNYRFSQAGEKLRIFTWDDLADWYLEVSKFEKENKPEILNYILQNLLKLWHPFIPFVTEHIWKETNNNGLLMISAWPSCAKIKEDNQNKKFDLVIEIIKAIRNARAENKVEPAKKIKVVIYAGEDFKFVKSQAILIKALRTGVEDLEILKTGKKIKDAIAVNANGIEIYLIGAVDKEKEKARLEKEIANLEKAIAASRKKLKNKEFIANAPGKVVATEKKRLKEREGELKVLQGRLKSL